MRYAKPRTLFQRNSFLDCLQDRLHRRGWRTPCVAVNKVWRRCRAGEMTLRNAWQAIAEYPHGHMTLVTALDEHINHRRIQKSSSYSLPVSRSALGREKKQRGVVNPRVVDGVMAVQQLLAVVHFGEQVTDRGKTAKCYTNRIPPWDVARSQPRRAGATTKALSLSAPVVPRTKP